MNTASPMTPQHRQHWVFEGQEHRIMTVTQAEAIPVTVAMRGFSIDIKVWGTDHTRKLYREVTPPGQKPRGWAGPTPALTWVSNADEPWVVFYRCDQGGVYWGLPMSTFTETFTPAPTFQS